MSGCGCTGCETGQACAARRTPAGRYRTIPMPEGPGGMRAMDTQYDVDVFGANGVTSLEPAAGWARGDLYRRAMPTLRLTSPGPMYDPTDPSTWRPQL